MNKPVGHTLTFDIIHYCSISHNNKLAKHTISFVFLHILYIKFLIGEMLATFYLSFWVFKYVIFPLLGYSLVKSGSCDQFIWYFV